LIPAAPTGNNNSHKVTVLLYFVVIEYVATAMGIIAGAAGGIAYVYRRGHSDGIDNACELRIKEDIRVVKEEIISIKESWELAHNELNKKIDNIKGSQDIILDLFKHNITPK
jgi:hypothetical protein